jgi:hypothetical protein
LRLDDNLGPSQPLILPQDERKYLTELGFPHIHHAGRRLDELLLEVWRKQQEIHNLSQPGSRDEAETGQVSVIVDIAAVHHLLELDRERHQARDPWNARRHLGEPLRLWRSPSAPGPVEGDILFVLFVHFGAPFWQYSLMPFEL